MIFLIDFFKFMGIFLPHQSYVGLEIIFELFI